MAHNTSIVRRDPFTGMRQMMDRLFDDSFFRSGPAGWPAAAWSLEEGTLPVDLSQADGQIKVRASLPGFKTEDIDVQVHEGVLSIKAEHDEEHESPDERYYRRERVSGSVSRRIALPGVVRDAEVDAHLGGRRAHPDASAPQAAAAEADRDSRQLVPPRRLSCRRSGALSTAPGFAPGPLLCARCRVRG